VTLRVLVVDDEPPARRKLAAHLQKEPGVELVGEARDGLEAVSAIQELGPDLVFLDVQMPGLDGFEVIEAVGIERMPPVVFVTAYDEFAVKAFEVQAVDYLLKPFDQARFKKAFARGARRAHGKPAGDGELLLRVLEAVRPAARLERLVVRDQGRLLLVPIREVQRLSAEGNYVRVHAAGKTHLVRETLARLEARLDAARFVRIHRSEIVALDAIQELQPFFHGDYVVVLRNGERLRLSRRYQERVLKELAG
jgi:two-component system LytT family response regulator